MINDAKLPLTKYVLFAFGLFMILTVDEANHDTCYILGVSLALMFILEKVCNNGVREMFTKEENDDESTNKETKKIDNKKKESQLVQGMDDDNYALINDDEQAFEQSKKQHPVCDYKTSVKMPGYYLLNNNKFSNKGVNYNPNSGKVTDSSYENLLSNT